MCKLPARLARGEHDSDPLCEQATGDECEGQRRGSIEPLCVVDQAQDRSLITSVREQAQNGEPDEERIWSSAGAETGGSLQSLTLRSRQRVDPVEQRAAELMETGVSELHLRLDPHRSENGQVRRRPDQVLEQRRLADPSLTAHHQRGTLSPADRTDQRVEQRALVGPTEQSRLPQFPSVNVHGSKRIVEQFRHR